MTIIESPLFDSCKECACCEKAIPRDDDLDLDEDVIEEENRVANMVLSDDEDGEGVSKSTDKKIEVEDVEK